jgi:hypothetical protein
LFTFAIAKRFIAMAPGELSRFLKLTKLHAHKQLSELVNHDSSLQESLRRFG